MVRLPARPSTPPLSFLHRGAIKVILWQQLMQQICYPERKYLFWGMAKRGFNRMDGANWKKKEKKNECVCSCLSDLSNVLVFILLHYCSSVSLIGQRILFSGIYNNTTSRKAEYSMSFTLHFLNNIKQKIRGTGTRSITASPVVTCWTPFLSLNCICRGNKSQQSDFMAWVTGHIFNIFMSHCNTDCLAHTEKTFPLVYWRLGFRFLPDPHFNCFRLAEKKHWKQSSFSSQSSS